MFASLHHTLTAMREAGYRVEVPASIDELRERILSGNAHPTPRTLYWKIAGQFALRNGDWKLITGTKTPAKNALFNLTEDPYEKRDLAVKFPDRVAKLKHILTQQQKLDP